MGFLWELFQQRRIWDAQAEATQARQKADFTGTVLREYQDRLDRLELVTEALCTLLRDKTGTSEKEIADRIQEVDLTDGCLDGKYARPPIECPRCFRPVSAGRPTCVYCGVALDGPA